MFHGHLGNLELQIPSAAISEASKRSTPKFEAKGCNLQRKDEREATCLLFIGLLTNRWVNLGTHEFISQLINQLSDRRNN